MENPNVKKVTSKRVFRGKTEFVIDYTSSETILASKTERHFYQRMLRAYLKGKTVFYFGYAGYDGTGRLVPQQHNVLFEYVS